MRSPKRVGRYLLAAAFGVSSFLILCTTVQGADVTLTVVDQYGVPISGSSVYVNGSTYPTGSTAALSTGSHTFYVYPLGSSTSDLTRMETRYVDEFTNSLVFEWIMQEVTLRIVDQHGVDHPKSYIRFFSHNIVASGETWPFPINDANVYPNLIGTTVNNYGMTLQISYGGLYRIEENITVNQTVDHIDFEWITQNVTLRIIDQHGVDLPDTYIRFYNHGMVASGETWPFPINDANVYPNLTGGIVNNYGMTLQIFYGALYRKEQNITINPSVDHIDFEWITVSGPLHVVDEFNVPLFGSSYKLLKKYHASGDYVTLPITDNDVYPTITGGTADGYYILVEPITVAGSDTFQFEVHPDAMLTPAWVEIDSESFGLRFILNIAPTVDAGGNLSILSSQQWITTILGIANDPDVGATLTYRWLEDGYEVLSPRPVLSDETAPLELGSLPLLPIGNHAFTIEVTDGLATVSDSMVLTVDNSPPEANTAGDITVALGADVTLNGCVADYDGDLLHYIWSEGETTYVDDYVNAMQGGDPVTLTPFTIVGGLPLGFHGLTLTVEDGINPAVTAILNVEVVDTEAPTLAPVATPSILWPPNHKMVTVVVQLNASDNSGETLDFTAEVTSSENADKDGDGHTIPDFTEPVIDAENGTVTVDLRSERAGGATGRVYTILISAKDSSDNVTTATLYVICPHDKGGGQ